MKFTHSLLLSLALPLSLAACTVDQAELNDDEAFQRFADVASDDIGIPSSFQQNNVMEDKFFANVDAITGDGMQKFLENSPYNNRSWLADATVSGQRAADAIVAASKSKGINPIVMIARMQVEKSLISKTARPSQDSVDYAFGCGCPDFQACAPEFRGLDRQIECAASTLEKWYLRSIDGTGIRVKGVAFRSLDPLTVVPENHATASLYAYTPWVFNGGNQLVWQITRLYALHFVDLGEFNAEPVKDLASLEVYWARNEDGSYKLHALAGPDVVSVEYFVDGFPIGNSDRTLGNNFPDTYTFSSETSERLFEAKGFDAAGEQIALGVGLIDVTPDTAVFIRQLGPGLYDFGLERAPEGVDHIEVTVDGFPLTDIDSGSTKSDETLKLRYKFDTLGSRKVAISTFNADGSLRGTLHREFTFR